MRKIVLGTVIALVSIVANAGSQPPLPISLKSIPADMDQGRALDVSVVEPLADVSDVASSFLNILFAANRGQQSGGWIDSNPLTYTVNAPTTVRMVTFMPYSYTTPPSTDIAGFPCQATYYLSLDGGTTWSRIMETMWSAPDFAATSVALPVPILLPKDATVTAKLRLWMPVGPDTSGCRARASLWVVRQ